MHVYHSSSTSFIDTSFWSTCQCRCWRISSFFTNCARKIHRQAQHKYV